MTIEVVIKKNHEHDKKAFVRIVDHLVGEDHIVGDPIELVYGEEVALTVWDTRTLQVFEEQ